MSSLTGEGNHTSLPAHASTLPFRFIRSLLPYSLTPLLPYSLTPLLPYSLTPLLPYSLTPLLPYSLSSSHHFLQRHFDKQQSVFDPQLVVRERLVRVFGRTAGGLALRIERAVVARAEEAVVHGFPMDLAAQMRASAGEGDEVVDRALVPLSGDDDLGAARGEIRERVA